MSSADEAQPFGKLRSFFWPIYRTELRKIIPMLIMYSLIVFNYSLLKSAKDALVITARGTAGAEAIPFIKLWGILPMAILFTYIFSRLSNKFNREKVFYIMMGIFLGFFALFAFVLYPFREALHPHASADFLQTHLPYLRGLISVFRNWTFTLFYVMSELWGTTIMTVLFWGFVNEVSSVKVAKRFYAILGVGANIATIGAGQFSVYITKKLSSLGKLNGGIDALGSSLELFVSIVVIFGLVALGVYYWMNRKVFKSCPEGFESIPKKEKIKMGMRKNFATLFKSKYLLCVALIVLSFNLALNLVEVIWKGQINTLYPNPTDQITYHAQVLTFIGIVSTFVALFLTGNTIRRFGWTLSALITPLVLTITGVMFFSFIIFKDSGLGSFAYWLGLSPLALGVFFGSMQNVLSRVCKFTFFDATKEMSFIPLDPEAKLKGKAAIDGVGSRLGKSGGSIVHSLLFIFLGPLSASVPVVGVIFLGVAITWIGSVKTLGKLFQQKTEEHDAAQIDTKEAVS